MRFCGELFFAAMVVVWMFIERMMMMLRQMWENEFETDFENDDGNKYTEIGFEVDLPD